MGQGDVQLADGVIQNCLRNLLTLQGVARPRDEIHGALLVLQLRNPAHVDDDDVTLLKGIHRSCSLAETLWPEDGEVSAIWWSTTSTP